MVFNIWLGYMINNHMQSVAEKKICWTFIGTKDGNVLFNDALNTFYLWLYGVIYMVKDHSVSERKLFYMHHPTDRMTHTTAFVTPVVEHWLERIYNSYTSKTQYTVY